MGVVHLNTFKISCRGKVANLTNNVLPIQGLLEDKPRSEAQTQHCWHRLKVLFGGGGNENQIQEVTHYWPKWYSPVFIGTSSSWVRQPMCFPFSVQEIGWAKAQAGLPVKLWSVCIVHFLGWQICSITRCCHRWLSITSAPQERPSAVGTRNGGFNIWQR